MITSADIEAYYNITLTTEQKAQLDNYIIPATTGFVEKYCNRSFGLGNDFTYKYEATKLLEDDGWDITTVGNGTYEIKGGKLLYLLAGTTGQAYRRDDTNIDFDKGFTLEFRAKFDGIFQKSGYSGDPAPQIEILDRINGKTLRLNFYEDAIISGAGTRVDIDTDVTQYHIVKITISGFVAKFYLDGEFKTDINLGGAGLSDGINYFRILDNNQGVTGEDMESYYDYIYYATGSNYVETFEGGEKSYFIKNPPVNNINYIKVDDDTLSTDEYRNLTNYIKLFSRPLNGQTVVEIAYKGGYEDLPPDVQTALIMWAYEVLQNTDTSGTGTTDEIKRFSAGSVTVEYADTSSTITSGGAGSAGAQVVGVPDYIINILQYYRLTPIK